MEKFPHYLHPGDPFGGICASFYHNCGLCASRVRGSESGQLAGGGRGKILIGMKTLAVTLCLWVSSARKSSSKEGSYGSRQEDV